MGACMRQPTTKEIVNNNLKKEVFQYGEIFFLKHSELEKIRGNVIGGKERVEILLHLKEAVGEKINSSDLTFDLNISSIKQKNVFTNLGNSGKIADNNLYNTTYIVDYVFECHQHLNIDIIYCNKKLDTIKTTLGRIFGSKNHTVEFPLLINNQICDHSLQISIHAVPETIADLNIMFDISLEDNIHFGNLYFIISKDSIDNKSVKIYKSKEVDGNNFKIKTGLISMNDLCKGDINRQFTFELHDWRLGKLGSFSTCLAKIGRHDVMNGYSKIANCFINYQKHKKLQFVDYIESGLQISVICGIDYTASNGLPDKQDSLHFLKGFEPNNYEQAITSCASIVAYYDYDNYFPVFGFGANLNGNTQASHCFNANFQADPHVIGVEGIINAYKLALSNISLSGPTYFSPLLKAMTNSVRQDITNMKSSTYYIIMILTDGDIHDMDQTKDIIFEAASLPISIIIIGIGDSDFILMDQLDGDDHRLTNSKGVFCERDIVQFVKYNSFKNDINRLSMEVLAEIPRQVQEYYSKYNNFKPYN